MNIKIYKDIYVLFIREGYGINKKTEENLHKT